MLFFVAVPTPFDSAGKVDLGRLRAHVLFLSAMGVDGFVPTGSTGEFLYLTSAEREAIHRTVLDAARGRPVYPCIWDPNPSTTRYLADAAAGYGASGVIVPPPLYYGLDDEAVETWYRTVSEGSKLPVLAYHEPKRIQARVTPEIYARLRGDGVLAGLKDSSRDPWRLQRLCDTDPGAVYAGGDRLLAEASQIRFLGGFISGIGNLWPRFCLRVFKGRETQLTDALIDRVNQVAAAGGFRALKSMLGFGFRAPVIAPRDERLYALPPVETL